MFVFRSVCPTGHTWRPGRQGTSRAPRWHGNLSHSVMCMLSCYSGLLVFIAQSCIWISLNSSLWWRYSEDIFVFYQSKWNLVIWLHDKIDKVCVDNVSFLIGWPGAKGGPRPGRTSRPRWRKWAKWRTRPSGNTWPTGEELINSTSLINTVTVHSSLPSAFFPPTFALKHKSQWRSICLNEM